MQRLDTWAMVILHHPSIKTILDRGTRWTKNWQHSMEFIVLNKGWHKICLESSDEERYPSIFYILVKFKSLCFQTLLNDGGHYRWWQRHTCSSVLKSLSAAEFRQWRQLTLTFKSTCLKTCFYISILIKVHSCIQNIKYWNWLKYKISNNFSQLLFT